MWGRESFAHLMNSSFSTGWLSISFQKIRTDTPLWIFSSSFKAKHLELVRDQTGRVIIDKEKLEPMHL